MLVGLVGKGVPGNLRDGVLVMVPMMSSLLSNQEVMDADVSVPRLQELLIPVVGATLLNVGRVSLLSVVGATLFNVVGASRLFVLALTLLFVGFATLLRFPGLLKFPWLQDLQHICLYPGIEQYRLNTSILQKTDRSPRQRLLEILAAGKSELDLESHWMMALFWSPLQGGPWQVRVVIGRGSLQFPIEPPGREQTTWRSRVPLPHETEHGVQGPALQVGGQ